MTKYLINQPVWSRQHNRYFEPGEVVDFQDNPPLAEGEQPDPATFVNFDSLMAQGAITPMPEDQEVISGKRRSERSASRA